MNSCMLTKLYKGWVSVDFTLNESLERYALKPSLGNSSSFPNWVSMCFV